MTLGFSCFFLDKIGEGHYHVVQNGREYLPSEEGEKSVGGEVFDTPEEGMR